MPIRPSPFSETTPAPDAAALLGAFGYQENRVYLHSDTTLMPRRRAA